MREKILFCLPHAGGAASTYGSWKKCSDSRITVVPIELAGKGKRIGENQYETLHSAVDDIYHYILNTLNNHCSYGIFGHSMGALLAYEVYYKMKQHNRQLPDHMFLSGRKPPHFNDDEILHKLSQDDFIEKIRQSDGTPNEFFEHEELLSIFIPILREDYRILEEYQYTEKKYKMHSDITVFYGKNDKMTKEEMQEWKQHTDGEMELLAYDGGHFFIHEYEKPIYSVIKSKLLKGEG